MANMNVLIATTYLQLEDNKACVRSFVEKLGYGAVFLEYDDDIAITEESKLDDVCNRKANACSILVLIVGGRYRSSPSDRVSPNQRHQDAYASSVFNYVATRAGATPAFTFVRESIHFEYQTYEKNKSRYQVEYAQVDTDLVYRLLESLVSTRGFNQLKPFEMFDEITRELRLQWANLFADLIQKSRLSSDVANLVTQLADLKQATSALKQIADSFVDRKPQPLLSAPASTAPIAAEDRLKEFAEEKLVKFVLDRIPEEGIRDPAKLYKDFERTNSFEGFLKRAGVTDQTKRDLLAMTSTLRGYQEILNRYFGK